MTLAEGGRRLDVEVEPATPSAWRREPYLSAIRGWAAQGAASGLTLRVWVGRRGYEVTSDGEVDLGLARPASARGSRPR